MPKNPENQWKSIKIVNIDRQIHPNDLSNFNEIFRKDVTYDIKFPKNQGFTLLFRRYIFRKTTGEIKLTPPSRLRVKDFFGKCDRICNFTRIWSHWGNAKWKASQFVQWYYRGSANKKYCSYLTFNALRSLSKLCPISMVLGSNRLDRISCISSIVVSTSCKSSFVTPLNLKSNDQEKWTNRSCCLLVFRIIAISEI